jgi:transcriptional regulator with XRE-family HTH domain
MARFLMKYRCYNWKTKNPVIDKTRTILQDEGLYAKSKRRTLHELTGVSVSTYDGWFEGDTISPRHETVMATLAALGYEETFVKTTKINLENELEAAAKWREQQERARERQAAKPNGKGKSK